MAIKYRELVKGQPNRIRRTDEVEELDAQEEQELLFAFRGAGSSFGIITRILYQVCCISMKHYIELHS